MKKWFDSQDKIVKIILLVIPFVGWVIELLIRWSRAIEKQSAVNLIMALVFTFLGWCWIPHLIDVVFIALDKDMFLLE